MTAAPRSGSPSTSASAIERPVSRESLASARAAGGAELRFVLPALEQRRFNRGGIGCERRALADADVHLAQPAFEIGDRSRRASPARSWSSAAEKNASFTSWRSPNSVVRTRAWASASCARSAARRGLDGRIEQALIDPNMGVVGIFRRREERLSAGHAERGDGRARRTGTAPGLRPSIDGRRSASMLRSRSSVCSAWSCSARSRGSASMAAWCRPASSQRRRAAWRVLVRTAVDDDAARQSRSQLGNSASFVTSTSWT